MRNKVPALAAIACAALLYGCGPNTVRAGALVTGGDARRGATAIHKYGCGACHTIGGIEAARGLVGPPLTNLKNRMYVAGILPNKPENLIQWIRTPKDLNPKTAMPQLGVSAQEATDIAAYIYSIP